MRKISVACVLFQCMIENVMAQTVGVATSPYPNTTSKLEGCVSAAKEANHKIGEALSPIQRTNLQAEGRSIVGSVGVCKCTEGEKYSASRGKETTYACSVSYDATTKNVVRYAYESDGASSSACQILSDYEYGEFKKYATTTIERASNLDTRIKVGSCEQLAPKIMYISYTYTPAK